MIDAININVRYETPDETQQTRRERNEAFDTASPPLIIPENGKYLWDWYFDLSRSIRRVRDNCCEPIPPSEFIAWREATGNIVYPFEYDILRQMDGAYCAEMNNELADYNLRQQERAKQEAAQNNRRRK